MGGARTALFNWLYARHTGGTLVLRIEDTDRERSTEAHTKVILDGLSWLGIGWDEGPFFQGEYGPRHQADAERLVAEGKAYRCFCTREELEAQRKEAEGGGPRVPLRPPLPRPAAPRRSSAAAPRASPPPSGSCCRTRRSPGTTRSMAGSASRAAISTTS